MGEEHEIVQRVYDAKGNSEAADGFISDYLPFINAQVSDRKSTRLNSSH